MSGLSGVLLKTFELLKLDGLTVDNRVIFFQFPILPIRFFLPILKILKSSFATFLIHINTHRRPQNAERLRVSGACVVTASAFGYPL